MLISRTVGRFLFDRTILGLLMLVALLAGARGWLAEHPQHDPFAPLDLNHPPGWATAGKVAALRGDAHECRAVLERSGVAFTALPPAGEGACARPDRTVLTASLLAPDGGPATCPVAAAMEVWMRQGVQPAAQAVLGAPIARVEHLGIFSCRRVNGGETGNWSEHATGNAIDIAAFMLEDGRRISVLRGWDGDPEERAFLRRARDAACEVFGTVLSPEYNAAHADHLHLDQAARGFGGMCR